AKVYQSSIPEFTDVEVDQSVKLTDSGGHELASTLENSQELQKKINEGEKNPYGKRVLVALIDSGIDPTHEVIHNKKVEKSWNEIADDNLMYDDVGHGTHIAGILEDESQNITLLPYKVVSQQDGKLSHVIKAINQAIEDHANVINMSFVIGEDSY